MVTFKAPTDADRPALARVEGMAFNYEPRLERVVLDGRLCAYDGGSLVGTAAAIPLHQWFGGRRVPCSGISAVAVAPEYRGRGVASRLMVELLGQQRQAGRALSVLYPANSSLYRKLGYEFGGGRPQFAVPVTDLPSAKAQPVSEVAEGQLPELMQCFSRFASTQNGPVETEDETFFAGRWLAHAGEGTHQRTVVVNGTAGVDGYASYFTGEGERFGRFRVTCKHLVAATPDALVSLLSYFRRFENSAQTFAWYGPASGSPMSLVLLTHGFSMETVVLRWMARVLDVPAALEQRGFPPVDAQFSLKIDDELFPANRGPWLVSVSQGTAKVVASGGAGAAGAGAGAGAAGEARGETEAGGEAAEALSINAFSALYTGQATPADLVLAGLLRADDPRLDMFTELFAGPPPWMPDFF